MHAHMVRPIMLALCGTVKKNIVEASTFVFTHPAFEGNLGEGWGSEWELQGWWFGIFLHKPCCERGARQQLQSLTFNTL